MSDVGVLLSGVCRTLLISFDCLSDLHLLQSFANGSFAKETSW